MSVTQKVKKTVDASYDLELIKNVVAKGATEEELKTLLYLCKEYNLDPLKKEIYFLKYAGKATILTSRDGYLKIANLNENFDGIESDVVYQADKLTKQPDGSLHIEYGPDHLAFDRTKLSGAFCNVFRKDRKKSTTVFVSLKDYYKKGTAIWEQYIHAMILKVAESMALKRAFAISGLVTREEIEKEDFESVIEPDSIEDKSITEQQRKALFAVVTSKDISEEIVKDIMLKQFNKTATKDLTKQEAQNLIVALNAL
jgi:phage recombination protein Bet